MSLCYRINLANSRIPAILLAFIFLLLGQQPANAAPLTSYSYNGAGYLDHVTLSDSTTVSYPLYDTTGRLRQAIDAKGAEFDYTYDSAGALSKIDDKPTPTSTLALDAALTYDSYGRETAIQDASGTRSATYGDRNEVLTATTTYTGLLARTLSYTYYANGSLATMATPDFPGRYGRVYTYSDDAAGRMTGLEDEAGHSFGWSYGDNNWLTNIGNWGFSNVTLTHNAVGQVTDRQDIIGWDGTPISEQSAMSYDGAGNRTSVTNTASVDSDASGTTTYAFDNQNQLTTETSTTAGGWTNNFTLDAAGNPTTLRSTSGLTYNNLNQRTGTGFAYDANGNATSYNSGVSGGLTVTYDVNNKPTEFDRASDSTPLLTCGYRIDGQRAWKQTGATAVSPNFRNYFLYDQSGNPVVELNASGDVLALNTFGPSGLMARSPIDSAYPDGAGPDWGGTLWYSFDERGNTTLIQADIGDSDPFTLRRYDSFGNSIEDETLAHPYHAQYDPFDGFGGEYGYQTDKEIGLVLCGQRYYDPSTARWLTRDPIGFGGGLNLYRYCMGNPIMGVDCDSQT